VLCSRPIRELRLRFASREVFRDPASSRQEPLTCGDHSLGDEAQGKDVQDAADRLCGRDSTTRLEAHPGRSSVRYSMARRNQIFGISSFLSRFIRKVPDDGPSYYALALPHPRSRSPSRIPVPSARKRAVASYTDRRFPDPFTDRSEMSRGRSTSFTLAFTPSSEA